MSTLRVRLFGRFSVWLDEQLLSGFEGNKVQELFSYLLIHRKQPQAREVLASLLWSERTTAQSRQYLRKALWQLQSALNSQQLPADRLLVVDDDWIEIRSNADLWVDVTAFEQICSETGEMDDCHLDARKITELEAAIALYQADLLEGWYQDWCLFERERLQAMCFALLDRLLGYHESHSECARGVRYGLRILSFDRAHERTHRRLMRLHSRAGDRTAALRQFDRCVKALDEELGVGPSQSTQALYEQLRDERLASPSLSKSVGPDIARTQTANHHQLYEVLIPLIELCQNLANLSQQLQQNITAVETILKNRQ